MNASNAVYYFTRSFPFGIGEEWKAVELAHLAKRWRVVVVPYTFDGNHQPRSVPSGVEVCRPQFDSAPTWSKATAVRQILTSRFRWYFIRELLRSRAFRRKRWALSWLWAAASLDALMRVIARNGLATSIREDDTLVFFWGRGSCDLLPLLGRRRGRSLVRMHRYDLFLDQNDGYIPFRGPLVEAATLLLPTSRAGVMELIREYPDFEAKVHLAPLGASDCPIASPSTDGVLRIYTCSIVAPVKRLELLVAALSLLTFRVEWTHAGDGPLFESLRESAAQLPSNVEAVFLGWVDTRLTRDLFSERPVDVFVNVSASEGVPISIQEALSAGVPVLATDVGGTSDVVDETVGWLLDPDVSAQELAAEIARFEAMSPEARQVLREGARRRWATTCNADEHAKAFAELVAMNEPKADR